jgi:endonuclease I
VLHDAGGPVSITAMLISPVGHAHASFRTANFPSETVAPAKQPDSDQYYAAAQGKQGAALLNALHDIVSHGQIAHSYSEARRELFSRVDDPDGDDRVPDLMTDTERGPIRDEGEGYRKGMNTEHTWPQSQGATGMAKTDLHHLRTADIKANEKRGSYPYGEVVGGVAWSTGSGANEAKLGVDALGNTVFQPAPAYRGDIARGILYFYTRYGVGNGGKPDKFKLVNLKESLPTLLKWNREDPVSDFERQRNGLIQALQGNRNPFIDHPEWVDAADFAHLQLGR